MQMISLIKQGLFGEMTFCLLLWLIMGCSDSQSGRADGQVVRQQPLSPTVLLISEPSAKPQRKPKPALSQPPGMIYVPGGETLIGSEDGSGQEKPTFWVRVNPFWMDEHLVTVAEFRRFVMATGYKTQAEAFGDAGVFSKADNGWTLTKGACWHHPQGPGRVGHDDGKAVDDHPVTQVSWNDAIAYATWAEKRLPSELEWEHAARNARNDRMLYPFGNELVTTTGKALANTWNGHFPDANENTDGFPTTSPVGHFGKTPLGLTDMTGNVWEWCADWRSNYADLKAGDVPRIGTERVQRGGSFLCEPGWCHGYRVSGRSFSTPETALMHVGFRCVRDSN